MSSADQNICDLNDDGSFLQDQDAAWITLAGSCATVKEACVIVNPLPVATTAALAVCDNDADGLAAFTLTNANATVLGAQLPASLTVSYHANSKLMLMPTQVH